MLKQVAALPVRKKRGALEVMLVTSRETRRWIIPKGWPSKRMSDGRAAAREAYQEAGVRGKIAADVFGTFVYRKIGLSAVRYIEVSVFILWVQKEKKVWREKNERQRVWFDVATASTLVREPRLKLLIADLLTATGLEAVQAARRKSA